MKRWKEVSTRVREGARACRVVTETTVDRSGTPTCVRSVLCMSSNGQGISWNVNPSGLYGGTSNVQRVQWRSNPVNLGYKPNYPHTLIKGADGAVSVGVDSKDNLWVVQRAPVGVDAISKFDANGKLLFTLGDSVIGHFNKAHGMDVDANDNAWFADPSSAVILQVSPDGKVLKTIGERGQARRLGRSRRASACCGSRSRSPSTPATATCTSARVTAPRAPTTGNPANCTTRPAPPGSSASTRTASSSSQLYGNMMGAGQFWQAHDLAIDPDERRPVDRRPRGVSDRRLLEQGRVQEDDPDAQPDLQHRLRQDWRSVGGHRPRRPVPSVWTATARSWARSAMVRATARARSARPATSAGTARATSSRVRPRSRASPCGSRHRTRAGTGDGPR